MGANIAVTCARLTQTALGAAPMEDTTATLTIQFNAISAQTVINIAVATVV